MGPLPCVVDLSISDEDDDLVFLTEFPGHLSKRKSSSRRSSVITTPDEHDDLVILEDFGGATEKKFSGDSINESPAKSSNTSSSLDDDCCILDGDPSKVDMVSRRCGDDSDDLVVTGESGHVACRDYPHSRHLCAQLPFKSTPHEEFCPQCHCYVCEMLAPCLLWGDGTRGGDHCHASDKLGGKWKLLRKFNQSHPPVPPELSPFQLAANSGALPGQKYRARSFPHPTAHEQIPVPAEASEDIPGLNSSSSRAKVKDTGATDTSDDFAQDPWMDALEFSLSPRANGGEVLPDLCVNNVGSDPTSYRGLLGSRPGGPARRSGLQVRLNHANNDSTSLLRSCHRHHHEHGMRNRGQRYLHNKTSLSNVYNKPYETHGLKSFSSRVLRSNSSSRRRFPYSSMPVPSVSAPLPRMDVPGNLSEDCYDFFPDITPLLDSYHLRELAPTFPVEQSVGMPEFQQQNLFLEVTSGASPRFGNIASQNHQRVGTSGSLSGLEYSSLQASCNPTQFQGAASQSRPALDLFETQTNGLPGWPCSSVHRDDSRNTKGGMSDNKSGGNLDSFSGNSTTEFVEFLLEHGSFWNNSDSAL